MERFTDLKLWTRWQHMDLTAHNNPSSYSWWHSRHKELVSRSCTNDDASASRFLLIASSIILVFKLRPIFSRNLSNPRRSIHVIWRIKYSHNYTCLVTSQCVLSVCGKCIQYFTTTCFGLNVTGSKVHKQYKWKAAAACGGLQIFLGCCSVAFNSAAMAVRANGFYFISFGIWSPVLVRMS